MVMSSLINFKSNYVRLYKRKAIFISLYKACSHNQVRYKVKEDQSIKLYTNHISKVLILSTIQEENIILRFVKDIEASLILYKFSNQLFDGKFLGRFNLVTCHGKFGFPVSDFNRIFRPN